MTELKNDNALTEAECQVCVSALRCYAKDYVEKLQALHPDEMDYYVDMMKLILSAKSKLETSKKEVQSENQKT